jgi:hypothetical protein
MAATLTEVSKELYEPMILAIYHTQTKTPQEIRRILIESINIELPLAIVEAVVQKIKKQRVLRKKQRRQ